MIGRALPCSLWFHIVRERFHLVIVLDAKGASAQRFRLKLEGEKQ